MVPRKAIELREKCHKTDVVQPHEARGVSVNETLSRNIMGIASKMLQG